MPADIEIQGHAFSYKPRTKANIEAVTDYVREVEEKRADLRRETIAVLQEEPDIGVDEVDGVVEDRIGYSEVDGPFDMRHEIARRALDGPFDKIDLDEVTWDTLEEIRDTFIPPRMQMLSEQTRS